MVKRMRGRDRTEVHKIVLGQEQHDDGCPRAVQEGEAGDDDGGRSEARSKP